MAVGKGLILALAAMSALAMVSCGGIAVSDVPGRGNETNADASSSASGPVVDADSGAAATALDGSGSPPRDASESDTGPAADPCVPNPDRSQEDGCGISGLPQVWDVSAACSYRGHGCVVFGELLCCPSAPDGGL